MNIHRQITFISLAILCLATIVPAQAPPDRPTTFTDSLRPDRFPNFSGTRADTATLLYTFMPPSYSLIGVEYDPALGLFWSAHESQSSTHNPTIFLVDSSGTAVKSISLSQENSGWPWQLDNRDGVDIMPNGNLLLPDYNGDLAYSDDNIVEITPEGEILNAWETDDEVGSNDSSDGTEIDEIIDIAVIDITGNTIHAFVTAAYDGSRVYEVELTRTGVWWTPNSWRTIGVDSLESFGDLLGVDVMGDQVVLSDWNSNKVAFFDTSFALVDTLIATTMETDCHTGICFLEGTEPLEFSGCDFYTDSVSVYSSATSINNPPEISDIPDQETFVNTVIGPLDFTVDDLESDPTALVVSASSDNQTLIPDANIDLGGGGPDRTISITPATDESGTAMITVTVEDEGELTATDQIYITVISVGSLLHVNSSTGLDDPGQDGSAGEPFATIGYAVTRATDGDTVDATGTFIADGTDTDYTGIEVTKDLVIRGQGSDQTFVQGHVSDAASADRRCFTIAAGKSVTIKEMTLQFGHTESSGGGAIWNQGSLTLENCVIKENLAAGTGNLGGGIYSNGSLSMINCTIADNTAGNGGGLYTDYDMNVEASTISGNTAGDGGGVSVYSTNNDVTLSMTNCTVSGNSSNAGVGGGFLLFSGGTYTLYSTITNVTIASNTSTGDGNGVCEITQTGTSTIASTYINTILDNGTSNNYAQSGSGTHTLDRTYTICRDSSMNDTGDGNQNNTDPLLGTLGDNGGDTETHSISGDSPAVDAGTSKDVPATDQRGEPRPLGLGYDIGSFERIPMMFYVNSSTGIDNAGQDGSSSEPWATIAYAIGRAEVGSGDILNITGTFTAEGSVTTGITVNKSLTLFGQPGEETIIQGHATSAAAANRRCITVASGNVVTIQNMTIRNGNGGVGNGGGILNNGTLALQNCSVKDNIAVDGGGVFSNSVLEFQYSTISGNTASSDGGGVYVYFSDPSLPGGGVNPTELINLDMVNCTVANNSAGTFTGNGGGLYLHAQSVTLPTLLNANLSNVTVSANGCSGSGNGIYRYAETTLQASGTVMVIKNSIVSNSFLNNYATGTSGLAASHILERTYTLCRDNTMDVSGDGNLNNTDPLLGTLGNNGGDTETVPTFLLSPAIEGGTNNGIWYLTDQRGFPHLGTTDMGAYEYGSFTPLQVQAKVFLEGAYDSTTNEMRTDIIVPITSPYPENERTLPSIPEDIVDWVLVQLRLTPDGVPLFSKSALLHKDGRIVDDDGTSSTIGMTAAPGDYYLVIRHRNHLSDMSDEVHTFDFDGSTLYDFTVDESTAYDKYYGGEAAVLETGIYGMFCGDADGSSNIDATDYAAVKAKSGSSGYHAEDCNMSGVVNATDYLVIRPNIGKITQVP